MPEILMPKLSDTMTEGTLVSWKKKIGDRVGSGEVLAEIETDKATMEWEATDDGILKNIYVEEGGKVNVGDRIAFIAGEGEEGPEADKEAEAEPSGTKEIEEGDEYLGEEGEEPAQAKESVAAKRPAKQKETKKAAEPKEESEPARIKASPLARKIATEKGIDLTSLKGSGPGGRIVERDVEAAADATAGPGKKLAPAPQIGAGETVRISLTGMRKVIAERLSASLGPIPHFYLNIEINAEPLMRVRAELKSMGEDDDANKITVNDFILKAAVEAAVREPKVNASFDKDAIVQYGDINLGVAVALEEGLVTPVVRQAQTKSLRELSAAVKDLAHRARNKRMKPEEFQGGTLTVSNLGSYGIDYFSAVINPPQAVILSVGAIVRQPVVNESSAIIPGYRMKIGLSCDHRVVDGAIGANYLKALRYFLENPTLLLL
ncbi:MAG TPA: pyruvate dehydrogenase complex dihydrolipoamide acetyltransferase [Chthoniobacterales bacterium]|jgi:pyruvate dehydrogenase E2 component (dihydrolipoamide acetyltransferase)